MFSSFFAAAYFAPRYFPRVSGATPPVTVAGSGYAGVGEEQYSRQQRDEDELLVEMLLRLM